MAPPSRSRLPVSTFSTSTSQLVSVPNDCVVVPIRPYTAARSAPASSRASRRICSAPMPHAGATASGVKSATQLPHLAPGPRGGRPRAPVSTRPSSNSVQAMAASRWASWPGRMKWCSSATSAVRVRRGSTTTTRPPRSRMRRSRPRMSGAVSRLPLDTSGLAPRISRWSVRSTSGTGMLSARAEHQPGRHVLGHLVDAGGGEHVAAGQRLQEHRPVGQRRQVVGVGVAHVRAHGVAAVLGQDGGEALVDHPERLVPRGLGQLAVGAAHQRRAQPVGVGAQVLQAGGLRAQEALAEHVLLVTAHLHDLAPVQLHGQAAGGLAEGTGAGVCCGRAHARPTLRREGSESSVSFRSATVWKSSPRVWSWRWATLPSSSMMIAARLVVFSRLA